MVWNHPANLYNGNMFIIDTATVIGAGSTQPDAGWKLSAHTHVHWEFIYFLKGSGKVDLPDTSYAPHQFHLVVYPPLMPHAEASNPRDPQQTVFLMIDVQTEDMKQMPLMLPDVGGEMGWLASRILAEVDSGRGGQQLINYYARAFLCHVEHAWQQGKEVHTDLAQLAAQYLAVNYHQPLSLSEVASAVNTTRSHLSHLFRKRWGITPSNYLMQLRLQAAQRLLCTTELRVGDVATQCGFTDPLYFSRVFHRAMDQAPSEYRMAHIKPRSE